MAAQVACSYFFQSNPRFIDFKDRTAEKALWLDIRFNSPWVHARLAAMAQCQKQGQSSFSAPKMSGSVVRMEELWQDYFSDPSQWWDNRFVKKSPKYPDFKHKRTYEGLWIESWLNPHWVKSKISTMALGYIESGGGSKSWVQDSLCNGDDVSKFCQEGPLKEALHIVELMVQKNLRAPINAYVGLLKGCIRRKALAEGKQVHALIVQSGLDSDIFLRRTLVDMYAKCGSVLDARKVFNTMPEHNLYSWTAIISAYADHEQVEEAMNLFQQMQKAGIAPDKVAFVVVLKACARIAALEHGKQLHSDIIKSGFESEVVIGNALIDMYAKCGCLEQASQVFNNMCERDVVSWTAMITGYAKCGFIKDARNLFNNMNERDVVSWSAMIEGYAQNGLDKEALGLYEQMKKEGVKPNNVTCIVLLNACSKIAALEQGKQLHSQIIKSGFEMDVVVGSALVDMYAKCGCIEHARQVFNNMSERDVVSWTAMIEGYAQQGLGKEALTLLEQMQREGTKPNEVTYVSVLSACSHSGLVDEGCHLFNSMCKDYGVSPTMKHYACMVDLLGRAGRLADAEDFIKKMPIQADAVVWMTLLGAARNHGHVEIGRHAFDCVVKLESENAAAYVLLANIYAAAGRIDEVTKIRKESRLVGL
ncbi:hypothetical protein O6H91_06G018700 [Diphasiastrum complanatum]|uniref:Uncharacterized protein n=2 Tax=Diphasiastrum complanatum TaxID=34168 RepID=A0ACC2DBD3_DIPCM|nr:hypothetical protein O6H91_06G018700 [Diphasiastrum complanatum]KAJ7551524.1 hypothetical protein O6H91_06G018700 [Diphasiastrum complanatum]